MTTPKIVEKTLTELLDLQEKLKASGQGDSVIAQHLEHLIERKACELAGIPWRD